MPTGKKKKVIVEQYHAVCNECGGSGCEYCNGGWQCTMEDIGICNKCDIVLLTVFIIIKTNLIMKCSEHMNHLIE